MKAVALQSSEARTPARKQMPQVHAVPSTQRFPQTVSVNEGTIQRKAECACGGGCPACQTKSSDLKVSQPNAHAEIEADHIADRVMRMPVGEAEQPRHGFGSDEKQNRTATSSIQRKCSGCEEADERKLQRKSLPSGGGVPSQSPAHVSSAISSGGQPLDLQTRGFFEPRLGYDLSSVRIHTDSTANQSARAIGARAYTLGKDIVFGAGEYAPSASAGRLLLAHEVAHVVQQSKSGAGAPSTSSELEANIAVATAARGGRVTSKLSPAATGVQRAVTTWTPPVRADEAGASTVDSRTWEVPISPSPPPAPFDKFSIFVPAGTPPETNNVHVFFAANPVVGASGNDVMIHGLRASAEAAATKWIVIGVPGFENPPPPGYQTINTAQIQACLAAAGRTSTAITSLRLTAHSRGHRGLENTLRSGGTGAALVDTSLIDRVTILDAFYQNTRRSIAAAGVPASRVVQYDLLDALGTNSGQRSRIPNDTRILLSSQVNRLAALGYVRILQDLRTARPLVASLLAANPLAAAQVSSITLPARGTFTTLPPPGPNDLLAWLHAHATALDAILAVDSDRSSGGLLAFINDNDLLGFGTGVFDRYIAAHHFFVGEIAHELFE